jgi:5-methylcytosine-specific restriction endonuclease McrA
LNHVSERHLTPAQKYATIREEVARRDKYKCIICGSKQFVDIHEIVPKSRFGKLNMDDCFVIKNMCCICRTHHQSSHSIKARKELLRLLAVKYKYNYTEQIYKSYINGD